VHFYNFLFCRSHVKVFLLPSLTSYWLASVGLGVDLLNVIPNGDYPITAQQATAREGPGSRVSNLQMLWFLNGDSSATARERLGFDSEWTLSML
jgi:hypothetical protein